MVKVVKLHYSTVKEYFIIMNTKVKKSLLFGNFYAYIVTGMLVLMTGSLLPYLMKDFELNYRNGGLLLSIQAAGYLCSGLLSGIASDFFGMKITLISGAIFLTIGFGGILLIDSVTFLFLLIFISGMGWGTMNTLVNTVVNNSVEGKASILNLLHMFFSIGGFLAPLVVLVTIRLNLGWHFGVILVVFMSAILILFFALISLDSPTVLKKKENSSLRFLTDKRLYILILILFFYVGSESSINGWFVTYLVRSNLMDEARAENILSITWVSVIFGRLICSYISKFISKERVILICSAGSIFFFLMFIIFKSSIFVTACVLGLGFCIAGIYPTTVANAGYLVGKSGIAGGLFFSLGGLGALAVPYTAGIFAQNFGINSVIVTIFCSFALLMLFSFINTIMKKPNSIKAIIFDLDGTIGETVPLCIKAFKKSIEPLLGKELSDEEITATFGPSEEGTVKALIPNQYEKGVENYLKYYDEMHDMCPEPFDGIVDILTFLKSKKIILAIVTGKGEKSTAITLSKYKINNLFDAVETGSISGPRKTEGLKSILERFRLTPQEAIYVGDAPGDISAAREASIRILSAAWASTIDKMKLKELRPDEIFYNIEDFKTYLTQKIE